MNRRRRTRLLSVLVLATALGILVVDTWRSPRAAEKFQALRAVFETLTTADRNQAAVLRCGERLLHARHNLEVITRATGYASSLADNTPVFMAIVAAAAAAESECPELAALLDVAVRRRSEAQTIIALAESACRPTAADEVARWRALLKRLDDTAEFETVAGAIAARRPEE